MRSARLFGVQRLGAFERSRRRPDDTSHPVEKGLHLHPPLRLPSVHVRFGGTRYLLQQIHTAQQLIDVALLQGDAALLRGHETVLHRVCDAHARAQADDSRRTLERMRSAHAALELIRCVGVALERQQSQRQGLRLPFRFHAKEVEHGRLAEILGTHARACSTAWNNSRSSSRPIVLPPSAINDRV